MPLPEQHLDSQQLLAACCRPAASACGSQTGISLQRNAHRSGRVAAQMLIGKEQHAAGAGEGPLQHGGRVARRANDAAVPAAKRLQAGGRIDVRDRRDVARCRSLRPARPSRLRPVRSRPCRPSSSRPPCRAARRSPARRARSASRSGRLARMSAVSAMKCTPQKAIARQSALSAAIWLS